ncbi:MAG: NADH-quinone oxidoreductase subunit L [Deltaproteobacteria bacterium]|nr:MAG: NADH-quinone oxidoreductase subunit L [Deltaproteobacteria bacterium]
MSDVALFTLLGPLGVALLLVVAGNLRRSGYAALALSLLMAQANVIASVIVLSKAWGAPAVTVETPWLWASGKTMATVGVHIDPISASMLFVVAVVAMCVQFFSVSYLSDEPREGIGRYFTWQSLFLFSMNALVLAPNLLQLFVAWELVGLCSYLLIGFWYTKPSAAEAALKAFWMTKLADLGLMIGLILQYRWTGEFAFTHEAAVALGPMVSTVALFYFIAVMGKSAQFPLHIWLPDAMEGPTPVSALLHAATMVAAGVYLVVRGWPIFELAEDTRLFMAMIGGFTAFFAACVAIVQTDIKKILAYSTCSQLGYMVAALGAGEMTAGYYHLTTHAFFKALLFLGAGSLIHAVHSNELSNMGGLWRKMPVTAVTFGIGTLALSGIPPFAGFFSKDLILEALLHGAEHDQPLLYIPLVLCVIAAGMTAYYMFRVVFLAFFGEPSAHAEHAHEGDLGILGPLVLLACLSFFAGIPVLTSLTGQWGHAAHFHVTGLGMLALALALGGIGLAWQLHLRGGTVPGLGALAPLGDIARSHAVDRFWRNLYLGGLRGIAKSVAWFDRYVIDALINLVGVGALQGAEQVRKVQSGRGGDYVYAVFLGLIVAVAWSVVLA